MSASAMQSVDTVAGMGDSVMGPVDTVTKDGIWHYTSEWGTVSCSSHFSTLGTIGNELVQISNIINEYTPPQFKNQNTLGGSAKESAIVLKEQPSKQ